MSFTHAQLTNATGELFAIDGSTPRHIRLTHVGTPRHCGQNYQSFSLLFDTDATDRVLHQGTYRMHHTTLGITDMFIAPIHYTGGTSGKLYYEAVFTRHTDS